MGINKIKIENEFFNVLDEHLANDEANEKIKALDAAKRQELIAKVKEYYQYLADNNIPYGRLALEVVNNKRKFGLMANFHLKHQCVFDGFKVEDIPAIRERIIISLAYRDMALRKSDDYNENSDFFGPIEDYHIAVFKSLATEYAWGGLAFRELFGTGSWWELYEKGGGDFAAIKLMLSKYRGSGTKYSVIRLIESTLHTWANYHDGFGTTEPYVDDEPFRPGSIGLIMDIFAKLNLGRSDSIYL